MSNEVDLHELAIDRGESGQPLAARRHLVTRYILPIALVLAFLTLVAWAARDVVFPPKPVTVVPVLSTRSEVRVEGTPLFNAAGWIEPRPTAVRVAALAPGVVERLLVVEDQRVDKGEPIAELVKVDARLARDGALAALSLCEAEIDEANAALTAARSRLEEPVHLQAILSDAEAALAKMGTKLSDLPFAVRRAEAEWLAARQDLEGKLGAKAVIAAIEIDIAQSKADAAKALVEELRNRAGSLENEQAALARRRDALKVQLELLADEKKARDVAAARVKAAEARAALARVTLAEQDLRLDRMTVRAPIAGRVFRLIGTPGTRIGSGSGMTQMTGHDGSTVVTLYRPTMLQVSVDVRFEDIRKVDLNQHQPVEINNPALTAPLMGKVLFVSSEADKQKNTLQVKVEIPNPPAVFKPEMLVDVTFLAPRVIEQNNESEVMRLYLNKELVHQDEGGAFVWLADQSAGIARKTRVKAGRAAPNGLVEITRGLTTSSRVVFEATNLQDGDRIKVTRENPTLGSELDPAT